MNQLAGMDMELDDEILALCLISSLPDSWETLVVSLSNSAPSGKLTLKMVKESMLNEENRRTERGLATQSQVLVTEKRGRSKSRTSKSRDGNDRSRGNPRRGMILNVIIVISRGISNLSADYGKGNRSRKAKQRKKVLIQQLPQMGMSLLSAMSIVLTLHVRTLIG